LIALERPSAASVFLLIFMLASSWYISAVRAEQSGWTMSVTAHNQTYNFGESVTFSITKPTTSQVHNCIVDVKFYIVGMFPDGNQKTYGPFSLPDNPGTYPVTVGEAAAPAGERTAQLWGHAGACINQPPTALLYASTSYDVINPNHSPI